MQTPIREDLSFTPKINKKSMEINLMKKNNKEN
jgi:hypothetical protein